MKVPLDWNQFNWKTGFIDGNGGRQEFKTEAGIRSPKVSNVGLKRLPFYVVGGGEPLCVCVNSFNRSTLA